MAQTILSGFDDVWVSPENYNTVKGESNSIVYSVVQFVIRRTSDQKLFFGYKVTSKQAGTIAVSVSRTQTISVGYIEAKDNNGNGVGSSTGYDRELSKYNQASGTSAIMVHPADSYPGVKTARYYGEFSGTKLHVTIQYGTNSYLFGEFETTATDIGQYLNKAPTLTLNSPANNQTIKQGTDIDFKWSGSDPDGDVLTYTMQVGTSAGASNIYNASVGSATSKKGISTSWAVGLYYWRVIANDGKGGVTTSAEGTFGIAQGNLVTLTKTNSNLKDAMVSENNPNTNYGTVPSMNVGSYGTGARNRSFLSFDLGLVPNNAVISNATLTLYGSGSPCWVQVRKVTSSWSESIITWGNQPTFSVNAYDEESIDRLQERSFDISTLVQEWVNGSSPNYGIALVSRNEFSTDVANFAPSDDSTNPPRLIIDYSIPATGKKQVEYVGRDENFKTGSSNITIGIPVGTQKGDLLIASVNNNASSVPITPPDGWAKLHDTAGSGPRYSLWYKFAGDNETGPTFSCSNSGVNWIASILAYRNVKAVREMFYATNISGSTLRPPNATTAYDNTIALLINVLGDYAAHATPPLNFRQVVSYGWSDVQFTLADSFKYMYKNKSLQSSEMGTTFSVTGSGDSRVIFLEPISNNLPSLTLTSPTNNQTLLEGNTMAVQGSVTDTDANDPVTIYLQINNGTILAVDSKVSNGATAIPFAKTLTYKNKRVYSGTTDLVGVDLAENTDHTLKVWAEDNKQGKSTEVTRKFRIIWNRPPVIDGENRDLGSFMQIPTVNYSATDPEGNTFTFSEYLNGKQIKSFAVVAGQQYTVEISHDAWIRLDLDVQHQIKIVATDSAGISSERVYTFTRTETHIEFLLDFDSPDVQGHFTLDGMPLRVLVTLERYIPEGATIESVKVCNNALDAVPTWEDCTGAVKGNRGYLFTNKTKTAANWAINLWVILAKGTATERVRLNGYGGAFD
ncbi:DNRLRE domain-containing protein [Brevibacillus formosus]|uniref:DNRLRE domain-containing protein n=1 Tax=Brevibacillus formosus TaxID=54913 RepID=UPI003F1B9E9D